MPVSITPSLGVSVNLSTTPVPINPWKQVPLGTVQKFSDGHDYVFAQASAVIAAGPTVVILTEPAMTVATGAGAFTWTEATALASGDKTWFKKTLI